MTKMTVLYAVFVAVLFVVLVRRHTRVEEENGQAELLGGTAVGRDAPLAAAVARGAAGRRWSWALLAAGVNMAAGLPLAGSLAFGASWAGIGLVSAGSRPSRARSPRVPGPARRSRPPGSGCSSCCAPWGTPRPRWLSWLSPLRLVDPAARLGEHALVGAAALRRPVSALVGAGAAAARRAATSDRGWSRPGRGRPRGHLGCRNAIALSFRVHGRCCSTWTVGLAVMGVVLGAIAPQIGDLLDSPSARRMMERLGGVGALRRR